MSEGVGDLLFFLASVLPVGWGISNVLTFVDERGLRGVSCIHVLSQPQRRFQRGVYKTEQKWHGSDKNWNGSNSFYKETVKFYPFSNWSIGACEPDTERIKLHCFFAKTIGTVPVFVRSVPFLLCRVNAPQDHLCPGLHANAKIACEKLSSCNGVVVVFFFFNLNQKKTKIKKH